MGKESGFDRVRNGIKRTAAGPGRFATALSRMIERTEVLGADPGQRIIVHEYREILFGILLQDGMSRRDASALLRAEQGAAPGLFEQQAQILSDYRDSQIGEDPTMQDVFQHYIETDPRTVIADSIAWAAARDIAAQAAGQAFTQGPEGL